MNLIEKLNEKMTAVITNVDYPKKGIPSIVFFKITQVEINNSVYDFSQMIRNGALYSNETIIFTSLLAADDPMDWSGQSIGDASVSVKDWLIEQGYNVEVAEGVEI